MKKDGYEIPKGLSKAGRKAARTIVEILDKRGALYSGGSKVFYSPEEWKERGEKYGLTSVLIVTYDGGAHRPFFTYDDVFEPQEYMREKLEEAGFWFEECTGWYCAVYEQ